MQQHSVKVVLDSKKDKKFIESTVTAFWKSLQPAGYLLTGEGVRIGYKSSIHQRFSLSQSKIVKNFSLSASTEQNNVNRFRESDWIQMENCNN